MKIKIEYEVDNGEIYARTIYDGYKFLAFGLSPEEAKQRLIEKIKTYKALQTLKSEEVEI